MAKTISTTTPSLASQLADRLRAGVREEQTAPPPGARDLCVLTGLDAAGKFLVPQEVAVQAGIDALRGSGRVYTYGGAVVFDTTAQAGTPALLPLRSEARVEPSAVGLLANLVTCECEGKEKTFYFPPPNAYLQVLLNAEPLARQLPRIEAYSRRPLFGPDFELLNPGYHGGPKVLIHGDPVEPDPVAPPAAADPLGRLPPHLRTLLGGFCFRDAADLANALALLLTGVLVNHFTDGGKPVALVDGNQPGLGKTLLVRVVGMLLDGMDPRLIHYTPDDEELQKRICSTLRPNRQSVLLIDNAKSSTGTPVSSPAVEANSMAPEISLRILGVSQNFTRPNDVLWAITMNQTRVSPDLVSRGLPIRLEYAGDPGRRDFGRADPVRYARQHRGDLLAELFGFVVRWTQRGRPRGGRPHRLPEWAAVIGGILDANHFPEFLGNYDDAAQTFNADLEALAALAEAVLADPAGPHLAARAEDPTATAAARHPAVTAAHWVKFFDRTGVLGDAAGKVGGPRAKAIAAGKYLAAKVDRPINVSVSAKGRDGADAGRTGTATLKVRDGRSREKHYWFAVEWADGSEPDAGADRLIASRTPSAPRGAPPDTVAAVGGGNGEVWE